MRYIGCKSQLLDHIREVAVRHAPHARTFCDIFSGTATVARHFKAWYQVYSNDLLYFSYCLQRATIENDEIPYFGAIREILNGADPLDYLNGLDDDVLASLAPSRRFFQNNYAPTGGRMYLTDRNALRFDFARNAIEDWRSSGLLDDNEYYYLVACAVEGLPFVSNISGTYGAYNKTWDRRSAKTYELFRLDVTTNGRQNRCFHEDGVPLAASLRGDILYIDPPYNARQYLPNYHVLETAARYDNPPLRGVTGQRPHQHERSAFCAKSRALDAFETLVAGANFQHLILSYNSDGIMPLADIERIMQRHGVAGTFEITEIPYRRFKSRSLSKREPLREMLIYVEKEVG